MRRKRIGFCLPLALGVGLLPASGFSAEAPLKGGTVREDVVPEFGIEADLSAVVQHASDSKIKDDATLTGDVVMHHRIGRGKVFLHLQGSSKIRDQRVAAVLPAANADAGSAFSGDGDGRVQVSELYYNSPEFGGKLFYIGMLDPTGFLDTSEIANDETTQFLGASFVNNPAIDFPDYTLGGAFTQELVEDQRGYTVFLSSSNGLGDNEQPYYSDLFDVGKSGKGVFVAAEFYQQIEKTMVRLGAWTKTSTNPYVDGSGRTAYNYGVYSVMDGDLGPLDWNMRLGAANEDVATVKGFVAGAVAYPLDPFTFGFGVAYGRVNLSNLAGESADAVQMELYASYEIMDDLSLTPSLQWLDKGGPGGADSSLGDVTVSSLRLTWSY